MPEISVIVPVYNAEKYLKRCLDSIIHQSFFNFELLLIDDGSTDMSSKICDNYKQTDKRVRSFHRTNVGVAATRNFGLDHALGKYIMFIDADDYVDSDYFKIMYEWIDRENCDIVQCHHAITSDSNADFDKSNHDFKCMTGRQAFGNYFNNTDVGSMYVCWNKIYKRELWNNVRMPMLIIGEDDAALNEVYYRAKKIVFIHSKLYAYFQSEKSAMRSDYSLIQLDAIKADEIKRTFIYDHQLQEYYFLNDRAFLRRLLRHYYLLNRYCKNEKVTRREIKKKIRYVSWDLIKGNDTIPRCRLLAILSLLFPALLSLRYRGDWCGG